MDESQLRVAYDAVGAVQRFMALC
eukprot:SAG25_NODE_12918_length_273_cov_1.488506_1_plen_23_part_01